MRAVTLLSLGLFLAGTGGLRALEPNKGGGPSAADEAKKDAAGPEEKDKSQRQAAALQAMRRALEDLPPGADADQIKKALEKIEKQLVADLKARLAAAEADVEAWQDRVAWSERMLKKGFITASQAQSERARLQAAETGLQKVKKDLQDITAAPKK